MPAQGRKFIAHSNVVARSRGSSYHAKGLWALKAKGKFTKTAKVETPKKQTTVTKTFKSRGTETSVHPRTPRTTVATPKNKSFHQNAPKVRASIAAGRVCIVLAGKYVGRRVVVLKVLQSGLAVVTGPSNLNCVPLRRIHPSYLIATSVKVPLAGHKVLADNDKVLNDKLFEKEKKVAVAPKVLTKEERKQREDKRKEARGKPKKEEEAKDKKTRKAKVVLTQPRTSVNFKSPAKKLKAKERSEAAKARASQRKAIQKSVDAVLLQEIKKTPLLKGYLSSRFQLSNGQYPHELKF